VGVQGVQSFSRGYGYWADSSDTWWGWSLAPWCVIGAFVLIVLFFSVVFRASPFNFVGAGVSHYFDEMAPELRKKKNVESIVERAWLSFLAAL